LFADIQTIEINKKARIKNNGGTKMDTFASSVKNTELCDYEVAWYDLKFKTEFLLQKGTSFQDFFSELMEKRHPSDFIRVRPWGRHGDWKNDGYLKSEKKLFQVYAPNEMKASDAINKIDEDFNGALPYWDEHIDEWIFVHNSHEGLGPAVTKKLLELATQHPLKKIGHWGFEELRQIVLSLPQAELLSLLGPIPTQKIFSEITSADIKVVLDVISEKTPPNDLDLSPVSEDKIEANGLSSSVVILLRAGMNKAALVEHFFTNYHDPEFGDKIAASFKSEYTQLKKRDLSPDEIFMELQKFATGTQRLTPTYEASLMAVLAHLFEKCDIFENPRAN
jgi:hypothetical protein